MGGGGVGEREGEIERERGERGGERVGELEREKGKRERGGGEREGEGKTGGEREGEKETECVHLCIQHCGAASSL